MSLLQMSLLQNLQDYYDNTSEEQIKADWEKSAYLDSVGPTADQLVFTFKYQRYDQPTKPLEPFKRLLTTEENDYITKMVGPVQRSDIDANGRINFYIDIDKNSIIYITEDDLIELMK